MTIWLRYDEYYYDYDDNEDSYGNSRIPLRQCIGGFVIHILPPLLPFLGAHAACLVTVVTRARRPEHNRGFRSVGGERKNRREIEKRRNSR